MASISGVCLENEVSSAIARWRALAAEFALPAMPDRLEDVPARFNPSWIEWERRRIGQTAYPHG